MGSLVGHVIPGFGFLLIGLWHLFSQIKLHALQQNSYTSSPWFPVSISRYLELFIIMGGSCLSIAMELFISPDRHQPLDPDGTIPSNHLHNFEHSSISMSFFIYAGFAILLDRTRPKAHAALVQLLGALTFVQEFLLFHLHSADHIGVEGQYHFLLQLIILVSIITTFMGIGFPKSFLLSFVRSLSIFFQGVWLIVMGCVLWTPELIPKGCFMNLEDGHFVVRCNDDHSLHRAKSLVNLQFSWFLAGVAIFGMLFYLGLVRMYAEEVEYWSLGKVQEDGEEEGETEDVESQKNKLDESKSFIQMRKGFTSLDIER